MEGQSTCLQAFTSVCWSKSQSQWYPKSCRFHIYQGILCRAVETIDGSECVVNMKRKQGEETPTRYIFVVDTALKNLEFTSEEAKFLKQVNFDGFVSRVTWKVLHEVLVREAIANLNITNMTTTVQGKTIPLLTTQWKNQLRDIFEFTTQKVTSTKKWELTELFPSLKATSSGRETVKVTDCTYPGAKKPLRVLSSLFCLNTTGQEHISIPFAELILTALNGNTIDWVEEFHQELQDEIVKLHQKHTQDQVKVERTAIGPHLTLILKAAGVMNLRHEAEARFHTVSPFSAYKPLKKRCTNKHTPSKDPQEGSSAAPPKPPTLQATVRVVQNKVIDLEEEPSDSKTPSQSTEKPQSVVIETEEPWQVPDDIPHLVQQITQAHRRLENLLTTFTSKAPPRVMRNIEHQFHKVQRTAILQEKSKSGESKPEIRSLVAQIGRLEEKLADKEELINIYIENSFEVQTQLAEKEQEIERAKKEIQTLTTRDQEELITLQDVEKVQLQLAKKEEEIAELKTELQAVTNKGREELIELQNKEEEHLKQLKSKEDDIARLKAEITILTHKDEDNLNRLRNVEEVGKQQLAMKEKEMATLQAQIRQLQKTAVAPSKVANHEDHTGNQQQGGGEKLTRLWNGRSSRQPHQNQQRQISPDPKRREEYRSTRLRTKNDPRTNTAAKQDLEFKTQPEFGQNSHRPLDRAERHILAEGAANQLLDDLQQQLQVVKQENEELQQQLQQSTPSGHFGVPQSYIHPKTRSFHRLLEHTEPLNSVMQYFQAYGPLHLLTSDLPVLKRGITLDLMQFKALWKQANPKAKDTLAFMWALGDFKLSLGIMEVVTGSPPFFIRRYILRGIAWLAQHKAIQTKDHNSNPSLPTLHPYTHSQKLEISKLQCKHKAIFQEATDTLRREDTTICFEVVRRHQWLLAHHHERSTPMTIPQLKDYATQTLEEHQVTVTKARFGTIDHGTIPRILNT